MGFVMYLKEVLVRWTDLETSWAGVAGGGIVLGTQEMKQKEKTDICKHGSIIIRHYLLHQRALSS